MPDMLTFVLFTVVVKQSKGGWVSQKCGQINYSKACETCSTSAQVIQNHTFEGSKE